MGVPKFFRYISERYPCLNEAIKEYQIPEFDNLYLDMNGIFHVCSHPNDHDAHFRITEEKIFKDIFHYLEILFRMIQPKKLFFMAVDGVAPRAKMNQQRGRRFRSAKEAELQEKKAVGRGEILPEEKRFDSNCITPGTEFMAKLDKQLRYFIAHKMSTDKIWQKPTIVYSGHETPGEGEHKIMDYIRYMRSREGWDPDTRHCLYGLDADLIMLGLCTHEAHFALLREEVKFDRKSQKRMTTPEESRFFLFHLSLLRGYLDLEFQELKKTLPFEYDIERIVDDWVLMGFLVGNDFIPNLPGLNIADGALHLLCKTYIQVLPTLGGYINESGSLNLERFEAYMQKLAEFDLDQFREIQADIKYFESKTGRKILGTDDKDDVENASYRSETMNDELASLIESTNLELQNGASEDSGEESDEDTSKDEDEEEQLLRAEFSLFKKDYYINKLEYRQVTPEVLTSQAVGYVRAIQWNLHYYYNGCASWSWYYPHHYSPYISDVKGFSNLKLDFELGRPFLPFQQLLAVLPSASKELLPKAFQKLMVSDDSPLIDFYPKDFDVDMNGKKQEWEAIVLIPFIDQDILLSAMEPCYADLTDEEKQRNIHGPMLIYNYTPDDLGTMEAPEYFPTIGHNHAKVEDIWSAEITVDRKSLVKGRYPGYKETYCPGFSTLDRIPFTAELRKEKVKVFEQPSRGENMILTLKNEDMRPPLEIARELMGKVVHVGWPHLIQALVTHVASPNECYIPNAETKALVKTNCCQMQWNLMKSGLLARYKSSLGIELGPMKAIVIACPAEGQRHIFKNDSVTTDIVWSTIPGNYPLQTTVTSIECQPPTKPVSVKDIFEPGTVVFMLGVPHYGCQGKVLQCNPDGRVKIQVLVKGNPNVNIVNAISANHKKNYMSGNQAAHRLGLSSHLWSRITGTIYVIQNTEHKANIGLNLKFNKKNEELLGYTRKEGNQWFYSDKSVALVKDYMEKFPELFAFLSSNAGEDIFCIDNVFSENASDKVKEITAWLKEQPHNLAERRSVGMTSLEAEALTELENLVAAFKPTQMRKVTMTIRPHLLYLPKPHLDLVPDQNVKHHNLLDRVVSIRECHTIPLGLRGTIIGIDKKENDNETLYDVMLDEAFVGGLSPPGCRDPRCYRLTRHAFINLSACPAAEDASASTNRIIREVQSRLATASINSHNMPLVQSNDTTDKSRNSSAFANWRNKEQQQQPQLLQNQGHISQQVSGSTPVSAFFSAYQNSRKDESGALNQGAQALVPQAQKPTADTEFQAMWSILQNQKLEPKVAPKPTNNTSSSSSSVVGAGPPQPEPLAAAVSQQTDALKKFLKLATNAPASLRPDAPTMQASKPQKPCGHASCCSHLITVCQKMGIAYPVYNYAPNLLSKLVTCTIRFPGILREFPGQPDKEKSAAAESAACHAIQVLMQEEVQVRDHHQNRLIEHHQQQFFHHQQQPQQQQVFLRQQPPPPGFHHPPTQSIQGHMKQNLPTPPQKWYAQHPHMNKIDPNMQIRLKTRDNNQLRPMNPAGQGQQQQQQQGGGGRGGLNQFVPLQVQKGSGRFGPANNSGGGARAQPVGHNYNNNPRTGNHQRNSPAKKSTAGGGSQQQQQQQHQHEQPADGKNNPNRKNNSNGENSNKSSSYIQLLTNSREVPSQEDSSNKSEKKTRPSRRMRLKSRLAAKFPVPMDN